MIEEEKKFKRNFIIVLVIAIIICIIGLGIFVSAESTDWFGKTYIDEEQRSAGTIIIVIGVIGILGSFIYRYNINKKIKMKKENEKKEVDDIQNTLDKLKQLYQNKEISKEEYEKRKAILLKRL